MAGFRFRAALLSCFFLLAIAGTSAAADGPAAQESLVFNADLSGGSGNSPDHWRSEGWSQGPEFTTYTWKHEKGHAAELEVTSDKPNDARWMQPLNLGPGWYRFEAEIRTENVGKDATGASISVMEDGINSEDVRGTHGWRRVGFDLKIGHRGADVDLALRLGGFSSLNTGKASFRDIGLRKLVSVPAGGDRQFDLDAVRKESAGEPIGHLWSLLATFAFLALLGASGWMMYFRANQSAFGESPDEREEPRRAARR